MRKKDKIIKIIKKSSACLLCLSMVTAAMAPYDAYATYDSSLTVNLSDSEIPEASMVVGTHLIAVDAVDDYIYEIASRSADESGQDVIYYKSELSDGSWYDISSASDLSDISSDGTAVDTETIENLSFTHQTTADGITYDLYNMQPVCIFDIYDPYDLDTMTELYSISYKLKTLRNKNEKTDSDLYIIEELADFYDTDLSTSQTDQYDKQMDALENYYEILCEEGATTDKLNTLHAVMSKLDAKRRATVYKAVYSSQLPTLLKKAQGLTKNMEVENFVPDDELIELIQEALTSVNQSYESYSNSMMSKGTTTLSELEYSYSQKLIKAVYNGDRDKSDDYLTQINSLYHIEDGKIVEGDEELDLIDDQLLSKVNSAYLTELSKGVGSEYELAVENNYSASVQEKALSSRADDVEAALTELEFVIQAREDRLSNTKAQSFIKKRISDVSYMQKSINDDAFKSKAEASVSEYLSFLTEELRNLVENSTEGSQMSKLTDQKQKLTEQRQQALDDNNLTAEKELTLQIEDLEERIETLSNELSQVIDDEDSTNTEKAVAKANLGSGNSVSDVIALKENAITYIDDREYDAAAEPIDGIITLMSQCKNTAITALEDINSSLLAAKLTYPDDSGIQTLLSQIQSGLGDNADLLLMTLNETALDQFVEDQYGTSYDKLENTALTELIAAFNEYYTSTGDEAVGSYMNAMAETSYKAGNPHIYDKLHDDEYGYVEIARLAKCLGYRYIYSNSYKSAALRFSKQYYGFNAYSSKVSRENSATDTLSKAAEFSGSIYIPKDYVETQFKLTATYLTDSDYGILTDENMTEDIDAVVSSLTELAEGL